MRSNEPLYDDGRIKCDSEGITIGWYYLWGAKTIPYRTIHSAQIYPLRSKWRLWGSGDFRHWYNLDGNRPHKQTGIEIDTGGRIKACITPDDAETVSRIITEHMSKPNR
jgi:hypothetical protein